MRTTLTALVLGTLLPLQVLALSTATPAQAQQASWTQKGDHYAPSATIVQQATPEQTKQAKEGDYYAPGTTIVQQPTTAEVKQEKEGDYYTPRKGN